jgi:hypothetical protein
MFKPNMQGQYTVFNSIDMILTSPFYIFTHLLHYNYFHLKQALLLFASSFCILSKILKKSVYQSDGKFLVDNDYTVLMQSTWTSQRDLISHIQ